MTDQDTTQPRDTEGVGTNALYVPHPDQLPSLELEELRGARTSEYGDLFETICGVDDDSQPVEQYDGSLGVTEAFVASHESAVAQVQWNDDLASIYDQPGDVSGVRWGTGTMISADLLLTCGHLFDQTGGGWIRPNVNGTDNVIPPTEIATNMHLNFGYQEDPDGNVRPGTSYPIVELLEYRLGGLDMAICRVGGNPGTVHGTTAVSTTDATVGEMLCIIGHPAGQPKRIEAGPATEITTTQLRYDDIDTLGGNSGSGVLSADTGQIVGVHTNGGCNSVGFNRGVSIEAFRGASPTLQQLDTGTMRGLDTAPNQDVRATLAQLDTLPVKDAILTAPQLDNPVTQVWLDTNAWRDEPPTNAWIDTHPVADVQTTPIGDVHTGPAGDVGPTLVEHVVRDPFGRLVNPAIRAGGGQPLRPFVLDTPHHVAQPGAVAQRAGLAQAPSHREVAEEALATHEEAIATTRAQLEHLEAAYTELYQQYHEAFGGSA